MFGHLPELFIILILALIVFGPEKLPEMAAQAGRMIREVRQTMDDAMHPGDVDVPDDFSTYYYDSLKREGEDVELDGAGDEAEPAPLSEAHSHFSDPYDMDAEAAFEEAEGTPS